MSKIKSYIEGIGHIGVGKYYYKSYLDRVSISDREVIHFRKIKKRLEHKKYIVLNRISLVEKILLKHNVPAELDNNNN